ncbi:uncharacterized protein LOC106181147 [Lingula anatina]|uniref:Uncharacterized protein LOC106181147 n=1 Tax=Lingula anatina TaxID=7574 RepID=A0A1S3KFC1_LINAN|nr:uncharacterized protein LOC106181147 [Lingula anatina]|eukprot:XP_013420936.1 uncharacterized protein LOC106181147 [Lingula anatina]
MKGGALCLAVLLVAGIKLRQAAHINNEDIEVVTIREVTDPVERELGTDQPDARYQFDAHGKSFDLRLKRNNRINLRTTPVHYCDHTGRITKKALGSDDDFTLYQDKASNAAVAVYTDKRDAKNQKKMEGFVIDADQMYEVRHLEDDKYVVARQNIESKPPGEEDVDTYAEKPTRRQLHLHVRRSADASTLLRTLMDVLTAVNKQKTDKAIELSKKQTYSGSHIDASVELMVCTDDTIWTYFLGRNNQDAAAAETELKRYYALITNGMDLRYQNIEDPDLNIYVVLAAYAIVQGAGGAPWFSNNVLPGEPEKNGRKMVNKTSSLNDWCKYRNDNYGSFSEHDHGMAFTM